MKIPYNLSPFTQCRAGAIFYTDYLMTIQSGFIAPPLGPGADGSIGYLCVCRDNTAAGVRCVYMREPPCDPAISGQCPTNVLL